MDKNKIASELQAEMRAFLGADGHGGWNFGEDGEAAAVNGGFEVCDEDGNPHYFDVLVVPQKTTDE